MTQKLSSSNDPESLSLGSGMNDEEILNDMGYKQEFKRKFGLVSMTGFGFSVLSCWVAMGGSLSQVMLNGGPASLVWGWLGCCICVMPVVLCMAEMCSAYPIAGGQYSWCMILSKGTQWGRYVSYFCGWIQLSGLIGMTACSWYLVGEDIAAVANLNHPDYAAPNWHIALISIGSGLLSMITCLVGNNVLEYFTDAALYWSLGGLIICFVTVLACAPKFETGNFVFTSIVSGGAGWNNAGMAVVMGIMQSAFGIAPFDSVAHIAEEIEDAPKQVPRAMVMAVVVSFFTTFIFIIALLFGIQDLNAVINTPTGFPLVEIFNQATGSKAGATCLCAILIVAQSNTNVGLMTEASRSVYAFARDGAFPLGVNKWLMYVSPAMDLPLYSMLLVSAIATGLVCILFGSTTAFSTVISISSTGLYTSYFLCILVCAIFNKKKAKGYYNFGNFAIYLQILALAYLTFTLVFMFFPTASTVDANTMNYDCVAFGIVIALALISWFSGAKHTFITANNISIVEGVEGATQSETDYVTPQKTKT